MTLAILTIIGTILAIVLAVLKSRKPWQEKAKEDIHRERDEINKTLGTWENN